jgi:uncharacterized membrane protein YedE/YeeE
VLRALALLLALAALAVGFLLHAERGRDGSFAWLSGLAFGIVLQRSRFGFAGPLRALLERSDVRGALAVLAALAAGSLGYQVIFGAQVPDPGAGYVPPSAFIGRVGVHTLAGGALFGAGMMLARGCIGGSLLGLGEGSTTAAVALAGAFLGLGLGEAAWNLAWVEWIAEAPAVWLPRDLGYAGALFAQLGALAALAGWLSRRSSPTAVAHAGDSAAASRAPSGSEGTRLARRAFVERWPMALGGLLVGVLATLVYFRGSPLGVTAELARLALVSGRALGLLPARLEGMETLAGCRPRDDGSISDNGFFVAGLVVGAACAAAAAGELRWRSAGAGAHALALGGGIAMGFGALLASGCTIGALLSGVMAFSLHGWVFALGLVAGAWTAVWLERRTRAR